MTNTDPIANAAPKKRERGRPVPGENDVGRERLLAATERLLRILPPARVTIPRIAREADVNPSLVYYYFGNRAALLLAVVNRLTGHELHRGPPNREPAAALADHIAQTVQIGRRAPFMNRLIIDELAQAEPDESGARVREMNLELVEFYRGLLKADDGERLADADPLYLFIAVLGASDFLSSAESLIRGLLPPDTDMEALAAGYQDFLVRLFMHGMLKT